MANTVGLSDKQLSHAETIISVGQSLHATPAQITVALMTAITESGLQNYANSGIPASLNLPHDAVGNDHASVGVFQQQVGIWGDVNTLMNVSASANLFYQQLLRKWDAGLTPWMNAQKVQVSAYPDGSNYQANYSRAQAIYAALSASTPTPNEGLSVSDLSRINAILNLSGALRDATTQAKNNVDYLYRNRLGRPGYLKGSPTEAELKPWVTYLLNGGAIQSVDAAIRKSAEFNSPTNQARLKKHPIV